MESMPGNDFSAQDALREASIARARVADRARAPWWYHLLLAVLAASLCLGLGLSRGPSRVAVIVGVSCVVAIGCGLLVRVYRHLTGIWVGPNQAGPKARGPWIGFMIFYVLCLVVAGIAAPMGDVHQQRWVAIAAAGAAFLAVLVLSPIVDAQMRQDLRGGQGEKVSA